MAQIACVSWDFDDRHSLPEHSHPEDQLVFASKGVMTVRTRQGIWVVPPMRAVWIPAMTPHSITMSGNVSMRTLYFLPGLRAIFDAVYRWIARNRYRLRGRQSCDDGACAVPYSGRKAP